MKWNPREYQLDALRFMLGNRRVALFLEPGLGKTSISLAAISALRKMGMPPVLLIAPLRVIYGVWPVEIAKWDNFSHLKVSIVHGSGRKRAMKTPADIYLTTPDSLHWLVNNWNFPELGMLLIDESTKFKSPNTRRFIMLKRLLNEFDRRHLLTGTPVPNSLLDIWSQMFILDDGKTLGRTFERYKRLHFIPPGPYGFQWKLAPESEDIIMDKVAERAIMMSAADYLKLPDLIENDIFVELPEKLKDKYKELEDDFFAELDSGDSVVANNAAAKLNKCRQFANGNIYNLDDEGERYTIHLHDEKIERLKLLIEEANCPMMIAYYYKHDLAHIRRTFGDLPNIGSGTKPQDADKLAEDWNSGKVPLMTIHPASSHGLNLQDAPLSQIVWYSLTYSLEHYLQLNARLHRSGRETHVIVHRIVTEDTVDVAMLKRVQSKDKDQRAFLRAIKEYRENK